MIETAMKDNHRKTAASSHIKTAQKILLTLNKTGMAVIHNGHSEYGSAKKITFTNMAVKYWNDLHRSGLLSLIQTVHLNLD